ncbi:MAG: phosphate ABC transporter permease PstA [Aquificae bacterium]|nr:phosphate ABC transporter permease PstA [Aquificota bacterium]
MDLKRRRKIQGQIALMLSTLAALSGLFWLVFIIFDVLRHGITALNLDLFLEDPAPPGVPGGGLRNAFVGHFLITSVATIIGVPIGVLGGTFIAEYARGTKFARLVSVLSDIMVSVPSIVVGTFIYAILVKPFGHFSGWAGATALAFIMIPVVLRTTEDMLKLVPWTLREAAFALGASYFHVIKDVVYRAAATGILTGIILAIARVSGETAPLLFTSFNNSYFTLDMSEPMASLTVTIFNYAMGPYEDWHEKAWAAAFIITVGILIITLITRSIIQWRYKN